MAAADDNFFEIFPNFRKKYGMIFHENPLFVIFEKGAKLQIIVCCKL